ncbi:MAG TPA: phage antirepressor N-terminal domain-containing protein [Pseudonocardiaceae bacterium]|jgi:hypothetical protein|nr:phage antirepressor N-terminal domain-containing protein [Pseudonocardiaceae bacterium]
MSELIPFKFHDDELLLVDVDGKPHIVLKEALDALGVEVETQRRKLSGKSWARTGLTPVRQSDGRVRNVTTVDVRTFLMLLATIDENRVAEHVRPKLIAYQSEVADAIEAYWTQGGAINPRATEDQLVALGRQLEQQAKVLSALKGVVDKGWLDAKGRHLAARALGEEPEIDPMTRPLTVSEYLETKGITGKALRSLAGSFGKRVKAEYVDRYDRVPTVQDRFVDGAMRPVAVYTERHRPLFDTVWRSIAPVT